MLPGLPARPPADDVLLSLSAKKKAQVQRSQEVVRGRVLLRNYTQAAAAATYDYNLRTEQVRAERRGWDGACGGHAVGAPRQARERGQAACCGGLAAGAAGVRRRGGAAAPLPAAGAITRLPLTCALPHTHPHTHTHAHAHAQWGGELHAHLSHAVFRFTDDQDVRLTAGVRAPLTQRVRRAPVCCGAAGQAVGRGGAGRAGGATQRSCRQVRRGAGGEGRALDTAGLPRPAHAPPTLQGVGDPRPYLRVQENCWALTLQPEGRGMQWRVEYDL